MSRNKKGAGTTHTPKNSDLTTTSADSFKGKQIARVLKAFREHPKTMLMVSIETGIYRANICRYVATLRQEYHIYKVAVSFCKVSKYRACYYSAAPTLFSSQYAED